MRCLTKRHIRILLKLVMLKSQSNVAETEGTTISSIGQQRGTAFTILRRAADQDTILINGAELLKNMAQSKYKDYYRELECWIAEGINDEKNKQYWYQIPKASAQPTPQELLDFIINKFRLSIAHSFKIESFLFLEGHPKYNYTSLWFRTPELNFVDFCINYGFIFQVRLYTASDALISKFNYSDYNDAVLKLRSLIKKNTLFYRGILRANNPFCNEWIILETRTTKQLNYYDTAPKKWKYSFYGLDDYLISSEISPDGWTFSSLLKKMQFVNAYYACVSFWDPEAWNGEGAFIIDDYFGNGCYKNENSCINDTLDVVLTERKRNKDKYYRYLVELDQKETIF